MSGALEKLAADNGPRLLAQPLFRRWLMSHGMIPIDREGGSIYDQLLEMRRQDQSTEAARLADEADVETRTRLLRGLGQALGGSDDPRRDAQYRRMAEDLSVVAPIIAEASPGLWDQIHGGRSAAALASALQRSGGRDMTPAMAAATAKEVASDISTNPSKYAGFSAHDMGQLFGFLSSAGYQGDLTVDTIKQRLQEYAQPLRAARDLYGYDVPLRQVLQQVPADQLGDPQQLARRLDEQNFFKRFGGEHQAPFLAGDAEPSFGQESVESLGQMDRQLTEGASQSPLAGQLGATMQLSEMGLLEPGTPGAELADQIRRGGVRDVPPGQWLDMMQRSGVDPQTALSAMQSPAVAEQVDRYNIAPAVRGVQTQTDLRPLLAANVGDRAADAILGLPAEAAADPRTAVESLQQQGLDRSEASQAWNAAGAMARRDPRFGGKSLQTVLQLGSPQLRQRRQSLSALAGQQADERSQWARQFAGRGGTPLQRTTQLFQDIGSGQQVSPGQAAGRVLNLVPTSQIPSTKAGQHKQSFEPKPDRYNRT